MNNSSEININTTDFERNNILSNTTLLVIPCTDSIDSKIGRFRFGRDLLCAAEKSGVIGEKVNVKDLVELFTIYKSTINESAKMAFLWRSPEEASKDMLTIISELTSNAELLQVEPYRHNKGIREQILEERQYLCAFEKDGYIYPTIMAVEKHYKSEESKIHLIVASEQIKKEVLPSLVLQHNTEKHGVLESSLPYEINITDIVSNFKREHSFLIKHFPDEMLSENQKKWKYRTIQKDLKKEGLIIDDNYKLIEILPDIKIYNNKIVLPSEIRDIELTVFDDLPNKSKLTIVFPPNFDKEKAKMIIDRISEIHDKDGPSSGNSSLSKENSQTSNEESVVSNSITKKIQTTIKKFKDSLLDVPRQLSEAHESCVSTHKQILDLEHTKQTITHNLGFNR